MFIFLFKENLMNRCIKLQKNLLCVVNLNENYYVNFFESERNIYKQSKQENILLSSFNLSS